MTTNSPPSAPRSLRQMVQDPKIRKRLPWEVLARTEQLPPSGDWRVWYVRGGRGSGKTRTSTEAFADLIEQYPGHDWAIIGPTFGDARDVYMEGDSGLLQALHLPRSFKGWNRSQGELFLPSGGRVFCDGADDGAYRTQGKNLAGVLAGEVGLWKRWLEAWDESVAFAVRIDPARIIADGTPKRGHGLVRRLMDDPTVHKTLLRTLDNAANLSPIALAELLRRYQGTTLGRQELEGEILADAEGALWSRAMIQYGEAVQRPGIADYLRLVVAIDPAVTYGAESDETGIVVGGRGSDGNGYILDDLSGHYPPAGWARQAIAAHDEYRADAIVGEVNNGGDLVEANLRAAGFTGRFIKVTASRGKRVRAEPIAALYEQGKVWHRLPFPELEDQLCQFTPESLQSPDRLDALVWAMSETMLQRVAPDGPLSSLA